ncbi:MAG TPA: NAD(P)/FAD-dependent oxidoreductase [Solirubrobacteraceae bacterium]|nr:NAD(P)/FAD-dependent oxidoreductase [Solirubrobacteraceae bacterium]
MVGAGPAGLGVAACLVARRVGVIVLEQGDDVASSWWKGYDRLRLNTSSWFSHLPDKRFPRHLGRWISRDDLIRYYRDYADERHLRIHTGVTADRIDRIDGGWRVQTSRGPRDAAFVVVATGRQRAPVIPEWPGLPNFPGPVIHSADYRNANPFDGQRVLVVGTGNSGSDISLDLAGGGAAKVWLSARRPPHLVPREVIHLPHDLLGVTGRRLPRRFVDANARLIRRLTIGNLQDVGLPTPDDGAVTRFEQDGRVPTIDAGEFVQAVRARKVTIVAGVSAFSDGSALLADGAEVQPDAVIAATGYHCGLDSLVGHLGVLDAEGVPLVHGGKDHPSAPRLYFAGFMDPRSGQLRELRLQARRIARAVSRMPTTTVLT